MLSNPFIAALSRARKLGLGLLYLAAEVLTISAPWALSRPCNLLITSASVGGLVPPTLKLIFASWVKAASNLKNRRSISSDKMLGVFGRLCVSSPVVAAPTARQPKRDDFKSSGRRKFSANDFILPWRPEIPPSQGDAQTPSCGPGW